MPRNGESVFRGLLTCPNLSFPYFNQLTFGKGLCQELKLRSILAELCQVEPHPIPSSDYINPSFLR